MLKIHPKNTLIVLAAVLVVTLGLLGYWLYLTNTKAPTTSVSPEIRKIQSQASSDEVDAIEKDLMDTDVEGIDKELSEIEAELQ